MFNRLLLPLACAALVAAGPANAQLAPLAAKVSAVAPHYVETRVAIKECPQRAETQASAVAAPAKAGETFSPVQRAIVTGAAALGSFIGSVVARDSSEGVRMAAAVAGSVGGGMAAEAALDARTAKDRKAVVATAPGDGCTVRHETRSLQRGWIVELMVRGNPVYVVMTTPPEEGAMLRVFFNSDGDLELLP